MVVVDEVYRIYFRSLSTRPTTAFVYPNIITGIFSYIHLLLFYLTRTAASGDDVDIGAAQVCR